MTAFIKDLLPVYSLTSVRLTIPCFVKKRNSPTGVEPKKKALTTYSPAVTSGFSEPMVTPFSLHLFSGRVVTSIFTRLPFEVKAYSAPLLLT